jgi:hypothetical protein
MISCYVVHYRSFLLVSTVQLKQEVAAANLLVSTEETVDLGSLFMLK